MEKKLVKIFSTSDVACPWCYVAYKRLDNIIREYKDIYDIELIWNPYMIDVRTAIEGEDYMTYNVRRWGGDGWVIDLKRSGAKDGCQFLNWVTWPNTLHAHRLIYLASTVSWRKAHEVKGRLFDMCYELGGNVSSLNVLIDIGLAAEIPNVEEFMRSDNQGYAEVIEADKQAKRSGISGVPHFVIESLGHAPTTLHGAQWLLDEIVSADVEEAIFDLSMRSGLHPTMKCVLLLQWIYYALTTEPSFREIRPGSLSAIFYKAPTDVWYFFYVLAINYIVNVVNPMWTYTSLKKVL